MLENHVSIGEPDLDWYQGTKCAGCGYPCFSGELVNGEDTYCNACWQDLHFCLRCDTRIFDEEVVQHSTNKRTQQIESDYFHPECFLEQSAEAAL